MSDQDPWSPPDVPDDTGSEHRQSFVLRAGLAMLALLVIFTGLVFYTFSSQERPPQPGNYFSEAAKADQPAMEER